MAAAALTPAKLQAIILQLQSQIATLASGAKPAGPAPAAARGASEALVRIVLTLIASIYT